MFPRPFTAFTQQPPIRSAFTRLWPLSAFFSIRLKFRKNVYAFVCFCYLLYTFSPAMYTFASLKCIHLLSSDNVMQPGIAKRVWLIPFIAGPALPTSAGNYLKNLILYYLLEIRDAQNNSPIGLYLEKETMKYTPAINDGTST